MTSPLQDFPVGTPKNYSRRPRSMKNEIEGMPGQILKKEIDLSRKSQWSYRGPRRLCAVGPTRHKLLSGVYTIDEEQGLTIFVEHDINVDDLMVFPNAQSDQILKEIRDFLDKKKRFVDLGFLHRRGYMFYGPAGSGKTAIVQQIMKEIVEREGAVFLCKQPWLLQRAIKDFREVEPDRQLSCIFEDMDTIVEEHGEDTVLSILDGELQVNNVLNIATTNYPEKLDRRIIGRPRRFDRIVRVGMPEESVRRMYFEWKLGIKEGELEKWVKATHNFSFAAMSELVISVKCLGHTFESTVETLRIMAETKVSSADFVKPMGF